MPGPIGSSAAPQAGAGAADGDAWIEQAVLSTPADLGQASGGFVAGEVAVLAAAAAAGASAGRSGDAPPFGNAPVSEVPELGANTGGTPGNGNSGNGAAGSSGGTVIEDAIACALGICASAGSGAPADPGNGGGAPADPGNGGGAPADPGFGGRDPETGSGRPGNGGRGGR